MKGSPSCSLVAFTSWPLLGGSSTPKMETFRTNRAGVVWMVRRYAVPVFLSIDLEIVVAPGRVQAFDVVRTSAMVRGAPIFERSESLLKFGRRQDRTIRLDPHARNRPAFDICSV